jgi:type II secretory pathway component PulF
VPAFYAGLLEAGVRSGRVAEVLATLTEYARTVAGLRATVIDATLYPAMVLAFSGTILGLVIGYLLPQYSDLFRQFGVQPPLITEVVLAVCRRPGAFLLAPILAVLGALLVTQAALGGTERGRCAWARAAYSLPIIGTLIRSARLAAFTDLLAILVDHGLPLPRAFQLAGQASSDPLLTRGARLAKQDLEAGFPVGRALREHLHVPELIAWMTATGQQRGELGKMLHRVAELYRRQVERRAALLKTVLPPLFIVVTAGVLVGLFVFALILPVVRLLEHLSQAS